MGGGGEGAPASRAAGPPISLIRRALAARRAVHDAQTRMSMIEEGIDEGLAGRCAAALFVLTRLVFRRGAPTSTSSAATPSKAWLDVRSGMVLAEAKRERPLRPELDCRV